MPKQIEAMTLDSVPKGRRPEEFLTDAGLADLYQRELDALGDKDPRRAELEAQLKRAKIAALLSGAA